MEGYSRRPVLQLLQAQKVLTLEFFVHTSPEIEDILLPHSLVSGVCYIALGQKQNGGEDFEDLK